MTDLCYLAFRDIANDGLAVLSGEVYAQPNVTAALVDWTRVRLGGAEWVPWDKVPQYFRGKRVCFLVHGFNVTVEHGVTSQGPAAQAYESLDGRGLAMSSYDTVVSVLWPGDGLVPFSYFTAFNQATATARKFAEFLLSSAVEASEVSFISHSLGAKVVLSAVAQTVAQATASWRKALPFKFASALFTAAAVDDTALDDAQIAGGIDALRQIVVLSSLMDKVLRIFFTIGDEVEGALWSNYDGDGRALGRYGPTFTPASKASGKTEWYDITAMKPPDDQDHGDYFPAPTDGSWGTPHCLDGWSSKRLKVATFCSETLDDRPYSAALSGWASDRTKRFRPDWTPKL